MDLETLISNVGFPIAAYILIYFRLEKKIDKLIKVLEDYVERDKNPQ